MSLERCPAEVERRAVAADKFWVSSAMFWAAICCSEVRIVVWRSFLWIASISCVVTLAL